MAWNHWAACLLGAPQLAPTSRWRRLEQVTRVPGPCGALPAGSLQASGSAPPCTGRPLVSPALMAPAELCLQTQPGKGGVSHGAAPTRGLEETPGAAAQRPWASAKGVTGRPRPCWEAWWSWGRTWHQESMVIPPEGGSTAEAQTLALGSLPHPQLRKLRPRKDARVLVLSRDPKGCREPNHCPLVATHRSSPVPSRASSLLQVSVSFTLLTPTL